MSRWTRMLCIGLACIGCGDSESSSGVSVTRPSLAYSAGTFEQSLLEVPVDDLDLQVVGQRAEVAALVNASFDRVALNLDYVDIRFTSGCLSSSDASYRLAPMASELLEQIRRDGITIEKVAVNVELLTPARQPSRGSDYPVLGVCAANNTDEPRFGSADHRRNLLNDFQALADLPGVERITIGVDMNALYHIDQGGRVGSDYSNFISVYREIYRSLKMSHPNVSVGPGLSFDVFERRTIPFVAERVLVLSDCDETVCADAAQRLQAAHAAYELTIEPFVNDETGEQISDFIGWSIVPPAIGRPFDGAPTFETADGGVDDARRASIIQYFEALLWVTSWSELPSVVYHLDWVGSRGKQEKAKMGRVVVDALSPILPAAFGWRRLTDLPTGEIGGAADRSSICSQKISSSKEEMVRPDHYCGSGLIDGSGSEGSYGDGTIFDLLQTQGN